MEEDFKLTRGFNIYERDTDDATYKENDFELQEQAQNYSLLFKKCKDQLYETQDFDRTSLDT